MAKKRFINYRTVLLCLAAVFVASTSTVVISVLKFLNQPDPPQIIPGQVLELTLTPIDFVYICAVSDDYLADSVLESLISATKVVATSDEGDAQLETSPGAYRFTTDGKHGVSFYGLESSGHMNLSLEISRVPPGDYDFIVVHGKLGFIFMTAGVAVFSFSMSVFSLLGLLAAGAVLAMQKRSA